MANKDDHLTYYREFFENFAQTINPNDPLPVKLASYKLVNVEVVGGIIDWTTQYLSQKNCPPNLFSPLIKIVIEEIRKACKKQPVSCGFNPGDHAYEPLKLMQTVIAKANEVCLRYLDNSMLCSLPSPDTGTPYCITSVCAVKNTRRRMEDRHVVIHDLNTMFNIQEASPSSYYAVFDGHAGSYAAEYCSGHLHQYLAENKYFASNPKKALLDAFCKTDALFIDKCNVENFSSGATAVVALLRPKEKMLYVAWAGDSQALLVNKSRAFQIVNPHKPCRQDERERIEKCGGCVMLWGTWRVNGQLAVSRAIGDPEHKPFVVAIPDIEEITLDNDDFLVIACDGLWDILSGETVARTVYNLVTENPDDSDRVSQRLVQLAKEQGSSDNISVIVVFLREPSKIAAEAHWANRNLNSATMETGLDNSNNPFGMSNGANNTDNIISQKSDGLLLNLTDNFKQNGTDLQASDFFSNEKSNGKRLTSDFDDEDFGPETDVDALDDMLSPDPKESNTKSFSDVFSTSPNNNLLAEEGVYNPFMEHQEKAALELENLRKRESREEFEEKERIAREETPTPPADTVHDVSGLVENPADSESEDEWDYIKGDEANKENISPQPEKEVVDIPEEDDTMSQLNPNAAEFVPVSPTRSVPSPTCRMLINDQIVSQSPKKANDVDINVPNLKEFEKEVKSRPSEIDENGHAELNDLNSELMENILNGKNIDEIPEFQPGSTPKKVFTSDEFHFGPNAAPFTPKCLDQSEAHSTKAVYGGDDTVATFDTTFNESINQDLNILNKESDPMSMSFYADKGDTNPFDLNKVQVLPDNLDDFLNNEGFNETISDLPEHNPLGDETNVLNNDDAVKIDKQSYDYEKELESPAEETDFAKTPEPSNESLIRELHCEINAKDRSMPDDVELISPKPYDVEVISPNPSPLPDAQLNKDVTEDKQREATEVDDLLGKEANEIEDLLDEQLKEARYIMEKETRNISDLLGNEITEDSNVFSKEDSSVNLRTETPDNSKENTEVDDLLRTENKDHLELNNKSNKEATEFRDYEDDYDRNDESSVTESISESAQPKLEEFARLETTQETVISDSKEVDQHTSDLEKDELTQEAPSPTPVIQLVEQALEDALSPLCDISKDDFETKSDSPLPAQEYDLQEKSEKIDLVQTPEPIPEHFKLEYPAGESKSSVCDLPESKSPISEGPLTPDYTKDELLEEAQERFEELCKPIESPLEETTSSIKDDLSFTAQDALHHSPIEDQVIEDSFTKEDINLDNEKVGEAAVTETESNSILHPASPLEDAGVDLKESDELPPPKLCICPSKPRELEELPIDVKTETISPEYPEQAVVTPSEESRAEELIIAATDDSTPESFKATTESIKEPELETLIKEPQLEASVIELEASVKEPEPVPEVFVKEPEIKVSIKESQPEEQEATGQLQNEMTAVGVAAVVAAGAAITAVVSSTKVEDKKKSPSVSSTKKTPSSTSKTATNKSPAPLSKTSPRLGAAPKTTSKTTTSSKATTPKTSTTKPPTSATSTTTAPKPSPRSNTLKPKTTLPPVSKTSSSKPTDKSPLTNGEVKTTARTNLGAKKTVSETIGAKTTSRPASGVSLSKVSQSKVNAKPNPPAPAKTTIPPRTAPSAPKVPSAAAKRPTTLTSKSLSATSSDKAASAVKASLTKTSPKSTTNVPPKPKSATSTLSKPKLSSTKTVAKAQPDTEKQIKESANKITASRSVTNSKPAGSSTTNTKSTLFSARKVESKVSSTRTTVSKTTTTTMKSTTAKKPIEVIRGPVKTKTTKIEKPKENGLSEVVTEEITIVNNTNSKIETSQHEPELIKDNSPVDNKLLIDTTQLVETNTD